MTGPTKGLRLAGCATHPIQYQAPVWRKLASTPGIDFHAYFATDMSVRGYRDAEFGAQVAWDTPLANGYPHTFLSRDPRIQGVGVWKPGASGLGKRLREFKPNAVLLTAYGGRFHFGALLAAKRAGARVVMRHEASDVAASRSRAKGIVRDLLLRRLYRRVDMFAVIGSEARRHLARLGVPASKLVSAPYCVDSDFFAGEAAKWGPLRKELRSRLGIGQGDVALVFSGKLIAKKDPLLIAAALRTIDPKMRERIHLIVAGDGELRDDTERSAREVLGPRAHFLGFLNQSEIGRAYAAADLLVLPSRRGAGETWGLVVNEAMQFGLGIVVSDGVGCGPDLVTGATGRIFTSGDPVAAGEAIGACASAVAGDPLHFAGAARRGVEGFTASSAASGITEAARIACGRPREFPNHP
jgi:glycosyltransferase involved in cell wall biosynthesis